MFQFFDTETSGLFDFKAEPTAKHQPHIAQLASVVTDEEFNIITTLNVLIEPIDPSTNMEWAMHPKAEEVHGISTEKCKSYGIPLKVAMLAFRAQRRSAKVHVGHNVKFDIGLVEAAVHRLGGQSFLTGEASFCTMHSLTNVLKIPGRFGFKWPKLDEAYAWANPGVPRVKAHDALDDVLACITVFKAIKEREPQLLRNIL